MNCAFIEFSGCIAGLASGFLDALGPILSFFEPGFARELMSSPCQLRPTIRLLEGTWTTLHPCHAFPGAALSPTRSFCSMPTPCPWNRQTRIWIPILPLAGCVALGKLLDLSDPQKSSLGNPQGGQKQTRREEDWPECNLSLSLKSPVSLNKLFHLFVPQFP